MADEPSETPSDRLRRLSQGHESPTPRPDRAASDDDEDIPTGPMARARPEDPLSESSRHPTGDPEQTAGGYGMAPTPGSPPPASRRAPHIDTNGMPVLPSRVPQQDPEGTRVQRSAWDLSANTPPARPRYPQVPQYTAPP